MLSLVGNIIITDEMWALVPMILEEDMLFCRFLKPRNEQMMIQRAPHRPGERRQRLIVDVEMKACFLDETIWRVLKEKDSEEMMEKYVSGSKGPVTRR